MKRKLLFTTLLIVTCFLIPGKAMSVELNYGSMSKKSVQLYTQVAGAPVNTNSPVDGTVDFKLVTVGQRTWAYVKYNGTTLNVLGDEWASQLRCWGAGFNIEAKDQENNLMIRPSNKISYGTNSKKIPTENPFLISIYQCLTGYVYGETERFSYNPTIANSAHPNDKQAPVLTCTNTTENLSLKLTLSATDDSGDYFYYIIDDANEINDVVMQDGAFIRTLKPETVYDIKVYAIDFSGNQSEPKSIQFTTGKAKDVSGTPSEFCTTLIGTTAEQHAYLTMETDSEGKILMSIAPYDGDNNTSFRNNGYNDARVASITVNGDPNTSYKYFTRSINAAKTQITFTPVYGMMNPGDVIVMNQAIEYKTSKNTNLYPTLKFTYTYGTNCSKATLVSTSVGSIKFNPYSGVQSFTVSGVNINGDLAIEAPRGLEVSPQTITPDIEGNITNVKVTITWKEGCSSGAIKIKGGGLVTPGSVNVTSEDFSEYCNRMISQADNGTNPAYMTVSLSEDKKELIFDIAPVAGQIATWNDNSIPAVGILLNGTAPSSQIVRTKTNERITIDFAEPLSNGDKITFGNPIAWTLKNATTGANINANVYTNTSKVYTVGLGCDLSATPIVPPTISSVNVTSDNITSKTAKITIVTTQGDFPVTKIRIREAAGKIADIVANKSVDNTYTILGLSPETAYSFEIVAIDTKGVESEIYSPKLEFTTKTPAAFESVVAGVANGLAFELDNEGTMMKVKVHLTNGHGIVDGSFKVVKRGGEFPAEDTMPGAFKLATQSWGNGETSIDKTFNLSLNNVAKVGDIVAIRMGYLQGPVAANDWAAYGNYKANIDKTDSGEDIHYLLKGSTGIEKTSSHGISINKEENIIRINAENEIAQAYLYTIGGQLVASGTTEISISSLSKGIYILNVKDTEGNTVTFKVIK